MEDKQVKKAEKTSIERLKEQYPSCLVGKAKLRKKSAGTDHFIVQEAEGLRFIKDNNKQFETVHVMKWSELPKQLYLDKLFIDARFYEDEKHEQIAFTIARVEDGDKICVEIMKHTNVEVKKRRAIQKVLGFRSGSIWKSAIAISVYALMLFFVIGLFVGNEEEAVAKPSSVKEEQLKDKDGKSEEETPKDEKETSAKSSSNEEKKETKSKLKAKESVFDTNDVYGEFDDPNAVETMDSMYINEEENKMYVTADGEVFQTVKSFDDLELNLLPEVDFKFLINHAKDSMPNDVILSKTLKENKEFLYHSNKTKKEYIVTFGLTDENNVTSVYVTQNHQK
ncbi:hypothetical protein ACWS7L_07670 [Exiguobacterium artemiae]